MTWLYGADHAARALHLVGIRGKFKVYWEKLPFGHAGQIGPIFKLSCNNSVVYTFKSNDRLALALFRHHGHE